MTDRQQQIFKESLISLFEKQRGEDGFFLPEEVMNDILTLLKNQKSQETDSPRRTKLQTIIDQIKSPLLERGAAAMFDDYSDSDGDFVVRDGPIWFLGKSVREHIIDALRDAPPSVFGKYAVLLQGPGTNELVKFDSSRAVPDVNQITGQGIVRSPLQTVFIEGFNQISGGFRPSTWKLLDACTLYFAQKYQYRQESEDSLLPNQIALPLNEFASLCGIPDSKASIDKFRATVWEDINTLYSLSIEWEESTGKGRKKRPYSMRVMSSKGDLVNGNFLLGFSPEMAYYLNHAYIMHFPVALLALDNRNRSAYRLGRKMAMHYSFRSNRASGNYNILSVEKLLEQCEFTIPSYDDVMAEKRNVSQKIIAPFEKALDLLQSEGIITWEYCNSKYVPLTDEQVQNFTYKVFLNSYIHFEMPGAPVPSIDKLPARKKKKES